MNRSGWVSQAASRVVCRAGLLSVWLSPGLLRLRAGLEGWQSCR